MKTQKDFIKNIKNNIVTKDMFALALYSVNKIANIKKVLGLLKNGVKINFETNNEEKNENKK